MEKKNPLDIVLMCGSPGSGKSTFYWTKMKPLNYERINQDRLKTVSIDCVDQVRVLMQDQHSVTSA